MFRKLVILSGIFHLLFCGATLAQNLVFIDSISGNILNGQTLIVSEYDLNVTHEIYIKTKNVSGSTKTVKVRRYETNVLPYTQNYFCWTNCYAPVDAGALPVWTDPFSVIMVSDSMYSNFSAYYIPMGIPGASSFRYLLFDVNNPDDSSFVDIVFDITVGNEEYALTSSHNNEVFGVYPNPASDFFSFIDKDRMAGKAEIKIRNILGEVVWEKNVSNKQGEMLSLGCLEEGLYFFSYFSDGRLMGTEKVIISR